jgi:hypothetical protein
MAKTAFFAPRGRKYIWVVMPFGLCNCPVIFLSMMHDLRKLWTQLCEDKGVPPLDNKGSTIIMDKITHSSSFDAFASWRKNAISPGNWQRADGFQKQSNLSA